MASVNDLKAVRDKFAIAASDLLAVLDAHITATETITVNVGLPAIDSNASEKQQVLSAEHTQQAAASVAAAIANATLKAHAALTSSKSKTRVTK